MKWQSILHFQKAEHCVLRPPLAAGKSEERRYRLIYFMDNQAVGVWSDIITVITLP